MDSELVADSLEEDEQQGGRKQSSPIRYAKKFDEVCGFYLSLGMSYEQFWEGDPEIVIYYRDKYRIDRDRKNYELWLQGLYVYEAIMDCVPVLNPFSKSKKAIPYRSEPYPLTTAENEEQKERNNIKKMEKGKEAMMIMMEKVNQRFKEVEDGS